MAATIVMLCSLDTKGNEAQYLKSCIEDQGARAILMDIGYGRPPSITADISAADIAKAAGTNIDSIYAAEDTGASSTSMMQGSIVRVQELRRSGQCDGIIAFGGASNTTLATGVMKTLPVGVPKLMISSSAAIPAYAAMYFGSTDITMMHAVVDISGLNKLTRSLLRQGAGAVCAMAETSSELSDTPLDQSLIAITSFRFSEACSQAVMRELEKRGYTPIPFHAQGVGEDAMEGLISEGLFDGVVDVVPAGLSEHMLGGNRAAKAGRLEAAGQVDIPQVVATSGFDMISCGPIERRHAGDALWTGLNIADRKLSVPDRFRVEARTNVAEVAAIACIVAEKLNRAETASSIMVPTRGWSTLSTKGTELYDPEADAAYVTTLQQMLSPHVTLIEVDAELNSEEFAAALVGELHRLIQAKHRATRKAP